MPLDALGPYAGLAAKHGFVPADHAAPRFFPVAARRLFDEKGHELPGYKRIVREDTGDTLNVTTDAYEVITNEEAFHAFEEAIRISRLDIAGMMIGTDFSHGGARVFRQYLFPAHMVPVKPGVDVALRIIMLNSYDGSLAFRGTTGAFNFVCANTSILGREVAGFRLKHGKGADIGRGAEVLVAAAESFVEETARWREWPGIPVTDAQAIALFGALPQSTKALVEHLTLAWVQARDAEGPQSGPNLWTLYNVLTAWATHAEARAQKAQARFDREERVRRLLGAKDWLRLAG
jgi:hypothetical protein